MDEISREQQTESQGTARPVDERRLLEFDRILEQYKTGKKRLETRVREGERWWTLHNEEEAAKEGIGDDGFRAKSGWLHNVLVSKHADATDAYPEPIVLPREPGDEQQARTLSAVMPVILESNGFDKTYSTAAWRKLKGGTAVYKVTWDSDKLNGLGDVSIECVDVLNLFWEPGITDIQDSRYVFHVELMDNETLEGIYPQLKGKLTGDSHLISHYQYDDNVTTEGKTHVIDVYYKRRDGNRTVLHYAKYVNNIVLASTENDAAAANLPELLPEVQAQSQQHVGLYDHGQYPFVFDALWPVEGSPCGYGYIDLCKNPQIQLDMMDTAFVRNALVGATPRYFQRTDSMVNAKDFTDLKKPIVTVRGGNLDDTGLRLIEVPSLAGNYISYYQGKVAEMRETSGNTETANGITGGGVTAASAIAALQEAAGKTSRDSTQASYRAFSEICLLIIELIRQFYDLPRYFRIQGADVATYYVQLDNSGLQPRPLGVGTEDMGYSLPTFDIKVKVQKRDAYSRVAQNELALQLYSAGFFLPQSATTALVALDMMDFEGKDELVRKLSENGTLYQQLQQMAQIAATLAQTYQPDMLLPIQQIISAQGGGGFAPTQYPVTSAGAEDTRVAKSRERAAQASQPGGR